MDDAAGANRRRDAPFVPITFTCSVVLSCCAFRQRRESRGEAPFPSGRCRSTPAKANITTMTLHDSQYVKGDFSLPQNRFQHRRVNSPGRVDGQQAEGVTPRPLHSPRNPSQESSVRLSGKRAPRRKGLPAPDTTDASSMMRLLFSIPDSLLHLLNGSSVNSFK